MASAVELLGTNIGIRGSYVISDGDTERHSSKGWKVAHALTDVVIDEWIDGKMTGSLSGVTLKQGDKIGCNVTIVKLIPGTLVLYV